MAKEIKIEVMLDEEQVRDLFEGRGVKFSKKKFDVIKEMVEDDFSQVEEALGELVDELISQEYEE